MYLLICFVLSFLVSITLVPVMRKIALKLGILDIPNSTIKTHKAAVPYLGGLAIAVSFWVSLSVIRFFTDFPTGTLRSLRGIFLGSFIICLLGVIDDIKLKGLHFRFKFLIQIAAGILLILYGIHLEFLRPDWFAMLLTLLWVVGITNAFNIIDIMDGLSSGTAFIAAMGFFLIGLPGEEHLYVNFASVALAGGCLGFLPYNLSKKFKIFMGDTGSLFIGFILASVSLGTNYTNINQIGLFAPMLILAIPVYDTLLVTYFRWKKGISPFVGSKDHFPLRLEKSGWLRKKIVLCIYAAGVVLSFLAFTVTVVHFYTAVAIYACFVSVAVLIAWTLSKIQT